MKLYYFCFLTLLMFSCFNEPVIQKNSFTQYPVDSFFQAILANKTKALNLTPINQGVDSFELRIWHGIGMVKPKELTIVRYTPVGWECTYSNYWNRFVKDKNQEDYEVLDSISTHNYHTGTPLAEIVDTIRSYHLDTFPSQENIPGFRDHVADGVAYHIELSTPRFYKSLYYSNPKYYEDPYNRKIYALMKYLNRIGVYTFE